MLPFTPNNRQQVGERARAAMLQPRRRAHVCPFFFFKLSRKRHIGNDMVTIVVQETDALGFSPITVRSHFQVRITLICLYAIRAKTMTQNTFVFTTLMLCEY